MNAYFETLKNLNKEGVRYVVVGLFGINFYSKSAENSFATNDLDIFIEPVVENVKKCCRCLKRIDMNLSVKEDENNMKEYADKDLRDIIRNKKVIVASDPYGIVIEILLQISGLSFSEINNNAEIFNVENIPVKTGSLRDLLLSKKIAGREKDKLFLKRYESELK
ncbi:hypothetical protein M0R36_01150 [bacterium]|jgi:predicted nucleotidyltransferase|nr:hypothetical protein [bacterium]